MRIDPILIHLATILIPGEQIGKDPYGRPIYADPQTKQIKCRLDQLHQRTSRDEEGKDVLWSYVLFVGPNENFDTNMKISNVVDKKGNIVANGTFYIEQIFPAYQQSRLHHYELSLSRGDGSIV